jgi:O-acetyl-ADP-ribose deacetylase (regulator of RNase III)
MPEVVSQGTQVNQSSIQLIKDDITDLDVDAFVFYAQSDLALGSGVGTAISVRGGPTIQKELEDLAPVATSEAVVSAAGDLKADYIIHAVGPKFQEENTEQKLRTTVLNSLKRAEEKGVETLAFPAMGAGFYGTPPELCAKVMVDVIAQHLRGSTVIKNVVICVLDTRQYTTFQGALGALG